MRGELSHDSLPYETRAQIAKFYEGVWVKTEAQRLYNLDRAKWLRGELKVRPGGLNAWKEANGFK
jgi:hypothetical protein